MSQRGQPGSVAVEGPSWVGYWNTYQYKPGDRQEVRKQSSLKGRPQSLSKFEAY
jgi:hypothetical protein